MDREFLSLPIRSFFVKTVQHEKKKREELDDLSPIYT